MKMESGSGNNMELTTNIIPTNILALTKIKGQLLGQLGSL
jgi:hypothetical protein